MFQNTNIPKETLDKIYFAWKLKNKELPPLRKLT